MKSQPLMGNDDFRLLNSPTITKEEEQVSSKTWPNKLRSQMEVSVLA